MSPTDLNQNRKRMLNHDGNPNLKGLSLAQLQAQLDEINMAIAERRIEELKVLADGYAKKLQMNGFSIREGMDALKPYLPLKPPR